MYLSNTLWKFITRKTVELRAPYPIKPHWILLLGKEQANETGINTNIEYPYILTIFGYFNLLPNADIIKYKTNGTNNAVPYTIEIASGTKPN